MGLIDNNKEECFACDNTGVMLIPNNIEKFDWLFDKYADSGQWNLYECRKKALNEVGYKRISCQYCLKGKEKSVLRL